MRAIERAGFLAHAETAAFRRRIDQAADLVREAAALGSAYVACSWGKDSVVLTHLAQSVLTDVPVIFFRDPEEEMIDDYAAVEAAYLARFPTRYEPQSFGGDRVPDKVRAAALWGRYPVALVGIRAEESGDRRIERRMRGPIHRYVAGPMAGSWRAWPLCDWTWRDVWGYVCRYDLPMLSSYEHPANADREHSRTCNLVAKGIPYGPKGAGMGRIAVLRERNPAYYNYLKLHFPEVARCGG